jgi:hypothetical protein
MRKLDYSRYEPFSKFISDKIAHYARQTSSSLHDRQVLAQLTELGPEAASWQGPAFWQRAGTALDTLNRLETELLVIAIRRAGSLASQWQVKDTWPFFIARVMPYVEYRASTAFHGDQLGWHEVTEYVVSKLHEEVPNPLYEGWELNAHSALWQRTVDAITSVTTRVSHERTLPASEQHVFERPTYDDPLSMIMCHEGDALLWAALDRVSDPLRREAARLKVRLGLPTEPGKKTPLADTIAGRLGVSGSYARVLVREGLKMWLANLRGNGNEES